MANKTDKKTIIKQQVKKSIKKAAAVLPIAALLIEEVRATEILDDERLAELALQEELKKKQGDTLMMGVADAASEELAEDEAHEDEVLAEAGGVADGANAHSGDLLLALNETADQSTRAASIANSTTSSFQPVLSGTGEATNLVTAVADTQFELSALPIFAAANPLAIGAFAASSVFALTDDTNTATVVPTPDQVLADGTQLATSLKGLQAAGIDAVNVATGVSSLHVAVGAAGALSATGLPLFGDANLDGELTAAEKAALDVTLDISNSAQLSELAALGGLSALAAAGVDNVQFKLADQSALNSLLASASLADDLAKLNNAGLDVKTIDMASGQAAHLSLANADALAANGLHFANGDQVSVDLSSADGTHLSTSLQNLQALGVSSVSTAAAAGDLHIASSDNFSNSGLPAFTSAHQVTLDLANVGQLHSAASAATALGASGIDAVQLNFADQSAFNASFAQGNTVNEDLAALAAAGIQVSKVVDMANNAVSVSDTQSLELVMGGIHFASNDAVDLTAQGTHMATDLSNLHKLGVDAVHAAAGITHLSLDVGHGPSLAAAGSMPVFDSALDVSLNIHNQTDFAALAHVDLASLHIDNLDFVSAGTLDSYLVDGLSVLNHGTNLAADANYGDLLQVLTDAGVHDVRLVDRSAGNVTVSDDLTAALYEAGMLDALPSTNVTITAALNSDLGDAAVLETSLKAMAELGVDAVTTTSAVQKIYVELGANADIADLISGFTAGSDLSTDGLFGNKDAGLVIDQDTFDTLGQDDITELLQQLSDLGFTEIDVLDSAKSYSINTSVPQAPVLSTPVTLGTDEVAALQDVFDTDIKDKQVS